MLVMATKPRPDGDLPEARRRLDHAVSALIDPKPHTVHRDDGTTEITWVDSLYDQLTDAVSGQSGPRSGGQTTTPVWADVLDELNKIHAAVAEWHPEWPIPDISTDHPQPPAILRLQAIQKRKWRVEDTAQVSQIAAKLEEFAVDIQRLLSGERILFLYAAQGRDLAPCPQCGKSTVYRPGPEGKPVRHPALQIKDGVPQCVNNECRATWPTPQFLANLLGFEKPQGVLD